MNIPKAKLEEFKKLYIKEYGVELSDEVVLRRALIVLGIMYATYY